VANGDDGQSKLKLVDYLGQMMRSQDIIDLLEMNDLDVIYDFDRFNEGGDDTYRVSAFDLGFEMRFDKSQRLATIFCVIISQDKFAKINVDWIGVPLHQSIAAVRDASSEMGCKFTHQEAIADISEWAALEFENQTWSYEFGDGGLEMIILRDEPPYI
jgi:hypothetical protein